MIDAHEFWLISLCGNGDIQQIWEQLNKETKKKRLLVPFWKFHVPNFKIGTLDLLLGASDELKNVDSFTEQVARKVATYLTEVLECSRSGITDVLKVGDQDLTKYLINFKWDVAKFPIKLSLKSIMSIITKEVSETEAELKKRSTAYNAVKAKVQKNNNKQTGTLVTQNIDDLVRREHFVLGSEYLTTLVVVVPLALLKEWNSSYEHLTDMVVPRSTEIVYQDYEHALVTVTLFIKAVDEFKHKAKGKKFVVKDFDFDSASLESNKEEGQKLDIEIKKLYGPLVRWLKTHFSEVFVAWIHVKALRVFSDSVIKYGVPVSFQGVLMLPEKKVEKKLRELLNKLYGDSSKSYGTDDIDLPATLGFNAAEYLPYASFKINTDFWNNKDSPTVG